MSDITDQLDPTEPQSKKSASIESVFRLVNREVWVVTAAATIDGRQRLGGLLATWVSQGSLDMRKPMVIVAIAKNHFTADLIQRGGAFGLHLISARQIELAWRFGIGSGRDKEKLQGLPHRDGISGAPIMDDVLAWLDCQVFHTLDVGDRWFYWANVLAGQRNMELEPLREKELFAAATDDQRSAMAANLDADLDVQLPLLTAWRRRIAGQ